MVSFILCESSTFKLVALLPVYVQNWSDCNHHFFCFELSLCLHFLPSCLRYYASNSELFESECFAKNVYWFLLSGCLNSFIFLFAVINKSLQKQDMFPVLGYLCQHSGNRSVLYQRYIFSGNLEILSLSQRQ